MRNVILAVLGSLFVAVCAQIQVPLWPVPVTGQTFAVLVVGMAFNWRLGGATLLLYLVEGADRACRCSPRAPRHGGAGRSDRRLSRRLRIRPPRSSAIWRNAAGTAACGGRRAAMLIGNAVMYMPGLIWLGMFYAGPGAQFVANTGASTAAGAAIAGRSDAVPAGRRIEACVGGGAVSFAWRLAKHR